MQCTKSDGSRCELHPGPVSPCGDDAEGEDCPEQGELDDGDDPDRTERWRLLDDIQPTGLVYEPDQAATAKNGNDEHGPAHDLGRGVT